MCPYINVYVTYYNTDSIEKLVTTQQYIPYLISDFMRTHLSSDLILNRGTVAYLKSVSINLLSKMNKDRFNKLFSNGPVLRKKTVQISPGKFIF